ncbi:MAG: sigma-54-dependent Fis family transcriptional regulator [Methylotenera sp.]|nr:sigma-54-dependent Fis family transcriptional regulator [Oligoflexia bacterium]
MSSANKKILGESPAVKELLGLIGKVAATKTNVLVIGESGTGKELVARMIHDSGPLKGKPFVPVNCGAIPESLIESEMFGHKRGSFTGAIADKPGLFEAANGGTLFLDEVGELPLSMQVKLLRAIQERVFRRVGGNDDVRVDIRIIAATNRDLAGEVAKGLFREDLYYRLNVILIRTPPLRERKGDIELLANAFLQKFNVKLKKELTGFEVDAMLAIKNHPWPGNIRELENVLERAVTLENGTTVSLECFPSNIMASALQRAAVADAATAAKAARDNRITAPEIRLPAPDFSNGAISLDDILGEVEKTYLLSALEASGGVKKKAADLLGITFRSIRYRLTKLGVESGDAEVSEDESEA